MARPRRLLICIGAIFLLAGCDRPTAKPVPAPRSATSAAAAAKPASSPRPVRVAPEWQSRVPGIDPSQVKATLAQANEALERGQLEQGNAPGPGALELYLAILAIEPQHPAGQAGVLATLDALMERGRLAMRAGRLDAAERIELIVRSLVAAHRDLGDYQRSLAAAREATRLIGKANAAGNRGWITTPTATSALHFLDLADRTFSDFEPVLAARRRWSGELLGRAWTLAQAEDFAGAQVQLSEAARIAPGSRAARVMQLRVIELRQGRTDAAFAAANAAVDRMQLDEADRSLRHLARIAAQPQGVAAVRRRIYLARHYGAFKPGQVFTEKLASGGRGPEMIVLPHGSFVMGSDADDSQSRSNETPAHEVRFARGFALARNEVTVGEFRRFVEATSYASLASRAGKSTVYDERGGVFSEHEGVDWRRDHVGRVASAALPVVHIGLADAQAYAEWLSAQTRRRYRLPSESEFEYALRAGRRSIYPWGASRPAQVIGNLAGDGDLSRTGRRWGNAISGYRDAFWGPAPVRNFPPERFSTFDLIGNVSEWTLDCWHDSYQRAPVNGTAWVNPGCPQRVVRGSSWGSSLDQARSAARLPMDSDTTTARLGFRLVREI